MNTDERTRHIIAGAFRLAAASAQKGDTPNTGSVSTWVSIAEAIVKEAENRATKVPPPAKQIAALRQQQPTPPVMVPLPIQDTGNQTDTPEPEPTAA